MLCKHLPMKLFEIWEPRYNDKKVLLRKDRIGEHNKIIFTKAPSMGTEPYYIQGKVARKHRTESNGSIMCISVPLEELRPLELNERCQHSY